MELFPAIDILDGKAVRLLRGVREDVTVYGTPLEMAKRWMDNGTKWLHLVDLNGAFDGETVNKSVIRNIADQTGLCIQVGGGIRSVETIKSYLDLGVTRVILGTAIFTDPNFLRDAVKEFGGERIVCGIDSKNGKIAIKGWVCEVDKTPVQLGLELKEVGIDTVVYTDISRDGALTGVNVDACAELMHKTGLDVIASGGLKDLDDIRACRKEKVYGAILGKALYENKFLLSEAFDVLRGTTC